MLLNSALAVVATVIMYISKPTNSFELILVARFLLGFGAGKCIRLHYTVYKYYLTCDNKMRFAFALCSKGWVVMYTSSTLVRAHQRKSEA